MPYFKKKPIIVFAEQWFPGKTVEGVICNPTNDPRCSSDYYVETPHEYMRVSPGDWIITDVEGGKYPCKENIFRQTYDIVDDKP